MKTTSLFGAIFLVLALGCTPRGPGGPPLPPDKDQQIKRFIQCFREEFNPTDAQLEFLKTRVFREDDSAKTLEGQLQATRAALEKGFESDLAESEVLARYNQLSEIEKKLSEAHFKRMLALRSVLSPEQRTHFSVCRKKLGPPQPPGPPSEQGK